VPETAARSRRAKTQRRELACNMAEARYGPGTEYRDFPLRTGHDVFKDVPDITRYPELEV